MLREIKPVKQNPDEGFRRWFTDEYWDLYVWTDEDEEITGLQLCYGKPNNEHALTWFRDRKFIHTKISSSRPFAGNIMSPILVADGVFDNKSVAERFWNDGRDIEEELRRFVREKILAFENVEIDDPR